MDHKSVQQVLEDFNGSLNRHADQMISILKEGRPIYGDMDKAILQIRQDVMWRGQLQCLPLIDSVQKLLNDEKSRLLVADGSST